MLIPKVAYAGQTDTADPGYPEGKARNATTLNDGTGFPLEKGWVNDLLGAKQALAVEAGITPSGDPDKVGASQELEALDTLYYRKTAVDNEFTRQILPRTVHGRNSVDVSGIEPVTGSAIQISMTRLGPEDGIARVFGTFSIPYTATGSGTKYVRFSLPTTGGTHPLDDFGHASQVVGAGVSLLGFTYSPLYVATIASSRDVLIQWSSTDDSGNGVLRGQFSFFRVPPE